MSRSLLDGVRRPFRALVVTFVPEASDLSPEAWVEGEDLVEAMLAGRPPVVGRQVRLLIRSLDLRSRLLTGRGLARLAPTRRTRMLEGLQDSRLLALRRGVWGLRTLAFLLYYGRADGHAAVDYRASAAGWEAIR